MTSARALHSHALLFASLSISLLAVSSLGGCGDDAGMPESCAVDCDCAQGQRCEAGACVEGDSPRYCCDNVGCPMGEACIDREGEIGLCAECAVDCDCAQGMSCTASGMCVETEEPRYCCANAGCPDGELCVDSSGGPGFCGEPLDAGADPMDGGDDAGMSERDGGEALDGAIPLDGAPAMDAGVEADAGITAMDAGGEADAGITPMDAGFDAGPMDAGFDAGPTDAGFDAGPMDAGFDAGSTDAGFDAGPMDAGMPPTGLFDVYACDVSFPERDLTGACWDGIPGLDCEATELYLLMQADGGTVASSSIIGGSLTAGVFDEAVLTGATQAEIQAELYIQLMEDDLLTEDEFIGSCDFSSVIPAADFVTPTMRTVECSQAIARDNAGFVIRFAVMPTGVSPVCP